MCNCNNAFILYFILHEKRWPISNTDNEKLGWISCTEAPLNVKTLVKVLLNLKKTPEQDWQKQFDFGQAKV